MLVQFCLIFSCSVDGIISFEVVVSYGLYLLLAVVVFGFVRDVTACQTVSEFKNDSM